MSDERRVGPAVGAAGLGLAVLGALVGWLLRSRRCDRELAAARTASLDQDASEPARATAPVAPAPLSAFGFVPDVGAATATFGKAVGLDDLEIVEGIGPVLAGVLRAGGITTWAELGRASTEELRAILLAADERHRMHDPSSWSRQARLAAIGEWEALKTLQESLRAGR